MRHWRSWSRRAFAWSAGVHALGFVLAGWATRSWFQGPGLVQPVHASRLYAVRYLMLTLPQSRPDGRPEPKPARAPATRSEPVSAREPVTPVTFPASPSRNTPVVEDRSVPPPSSLQVHELPPGGVTGVGQVIATAASDTSGGRGLLGKLGFRVPGPDEIGSATPGPDEVDPATRGLDRVAELVSGTASACPELRPPAVWADRGLAVAVAFVVDTGGMVDRKTLRVVASPGRPQTEQRFQSHVIVVGAAIRPDSLRVDPVGYDSVVTQEVASHVADLVFRPALREGRRVRSTVLISCQTSHPR